MAAAAARMSKVDGCILVDEFMTCECGGDGDFRVGGSKCVNLRLAMLRTEYTLRR